MSVLTVLDYLSPTRYEVPASFGCKLALRDHIEHRNCFCPELLTTFGLGRLPAQAVPFNMKMCIASQAVSCVDAAASIITGSVST